MKKQTKFSIWYVFIVVWFVMLLQNAIFSFFKVQDIPYSDFLNLLKEGKVVEVAVRSNQIQGKLKPGADKKENLFKTVRVDPETASLLEKYNITFKGEIESTLIPTLLSWIIPVFLFFGLWFLLMKRMAGKQPGFMALGKNKAKVYMEKETGVTFQDVAGVDEAKTEVEEVVEFLKDPSKYTDLGGKLPKGVLLVGPPGTGKTLLAKAVAGESNVPFFSMSGAEFVEMFVGMGAARVRDLFEEAKKAAPCIVFIDELDAMGKARGVGISGGHDEREQTLNQLLVEMDGFDGSVGVILLAATNRPEILDAALLRPGRFDRQILVDRPDKTGREQILKIHLKNIKISSDIDTELLASMTPGMVGADLANLVNEAALLAVRRDKKVVEKAEFEEAIERLIAGLEKKNRLINPREREIVAYHEMGHALVALSIPGSDPVQKISIIPRGIAALGYTLQVPTEDRFLMNKTELKAKIAVLLGGRAAEQIIFGDISTGAQNDLARVTDIARSMVKEYGMSERIGQVHYARQKTNQFLQATPEGACNYSEFTANAIDEEVKKIIDDQYQISIAILTEKKESLEKGARILLEKEKIEADQIKSLL